MCNAAFRSLDKTVIERIWVRYQEILCCLTFVLLYQDKHRSNSEALWSPASHQEIQRDHCRTSGHSHQTSKECGSAEAILWREMVQNTRSREVAEAKSGSSHCGRYLKPSKVVVIHLKIWCLLVFLGLTYVSLLKTWNRNKDSEVRPLPTRSHKF